MIGRRVCLRCLYVCSSGRMFYFHNEESDLGIQLKWHSISKNWQWIVYFLIYISVYEHERIYDVAASLRLPVVIMMQQFIRQPIKILTLKQFTFNDTINFFDAYNQFSVEYCKHHRPNYPAPDWFIDAFFSFFALSSSTATAYCKEYIATAFCIYAKRKHCIEYDAILKLEHVAESHLNELGGEDGWNCNKYPNIHCNNAFWGHYAKCCRFVQHTKTRYIDDESPSHQFTCTWLIYNIYLANCMSNFNVHSMIGGLIFS